MGGVCNAAHHSFCNFVETGTSRERAFADERPTGSIHKATGPVGMVAPQCEPSMKASEAFARRPMVLLIAALVVGGAALVGKRWLRPGAPMVGTIAQPMTLPLLANAADGVPRITLPSEEKRVLVLDLFETTCGPCKKSLPKAQYRFDAQSDVHFVAVCLDEERVAAEKVASAWGLTKEVAWDEKGRGA